jgi:2-polyprenyl-6-methoxyphenol hydroxylase-like FAD-dependent oxidoreductase
MNGESHEAIVAGAGPIGLLLARELRLGGVRTLVLERHPHVRDTPKAGGLAGQIIEFLRYRGLWERFEAAGTKPAPPLRLPFGGLHVDFSHLAVSPIELLVLPQPQLERLLDELAGELGAEIRRGHELIGLRQDGATVNADVRAPDGAYSVSARYLVGCDGAYSRVRDLAGIQFPGITYPQVNRLAQVAMPADAMLHENGDVQFAGFGRVPFGFTTMERGLFALASTRPGRLGLFTSEDETADYNDDEPMTLDELGNSIRRVLGFDIPLGEATRLTRFTFHARQAERYREGRILLAGDAAHLFPAPGVALNAGMMDAANLGWKIAAAVHGWSPPDLLDTYDRERRFASDRTMLQTQAQVAIRRGHDAASEALRKLLQELFADEQAARRIGACIAGTGIRYPQSKPNQHALCGTFAPDLTLHTSAGITSIGGLMRAGRPILVDLAGRHDLGDAAEDWLDRIDVHVAETDDRPADALLIRPDAHIAWAAAIGEPAEDAVPALHGALATWFGASGVRSECTRFSERSGVGVP